jgi:hypothetical protein
MNKNKLFSVLDSKINRALKERNGQNVVDLRLYINDICTGDIFSINEKEEIYNSVKDIKKDWFIDFYENINGENRAEFMDIVIYKKDVIEYNPNEVFVVEMTYFDETNGEVSVSTSIHRTEVGAKEFLDSEVAYTIETYKEMGTSVNVISELETNVTWCQGYYNIKICSKLISD